MNISLQFGYGVMDNPARCVDVALDLQEKGNSVLV